MATTQFTWPGIYIQEFAPGAPIPGVGTSTPAFIGPATSGEWNVPTKLTSFDQFVQLYGSQPLQGFYLWYAVRGFFENGGEVCYVVRTSSGSYGSLILADGGGNPLINIRARRLGVLNPSVDIVVAMSSLLASTPLYQPTAAFTVTATNQILITATATQTSAQLAAQFRPGDSILVGTYGDHTIQQIAGGTIRLVDTLSGTTGGTVRLSDALVGATVFRLQPAAQLPSGTLVPGTMLTFTQGTNTDTQIAAAVQTEYLQTGTPIVTYRVTLRNGLNFGLSQASAATAVSREFDLTVKQGAAANDYAFLSVDPAHPNYYPGVINNDPTGQIYANPETPVPPTTGTQSLPVVQANAPLPNGNVDDVTQLTISDYTASIDTLLVIDDVNLISVPDAITLPSGNGVAVQQYAITHCEQLGDRFAVLDARPGLALFGANSILTQRAALDSVRGYGGLYYPWLQVPPVGAGGPVLVPPSGHVCGVIAQVDNSRGVFKAPANEIIAGAVGLDITMSDADQGQINIAGVNAIRQFQGGPPTIWGARTTATDTNWQYVNVRRLFIFLEQSIQEGIRWAVFEPNNTALWAKLKRTITEFLTRVWRDGALFGATADQAFYVRIDDTLNPPTTRALGQLFIQVGVCPSYPAEFIILQIGIWQGGSSVSES